MSPSLMCEVFLPCKKNLAVRQTCQFLDLVFLLTGPKYKEVNSARSQIEETQIFYSLKEKNDELFCFGALIYTF